MCRPEGYQAKLICYRALQRSVTDLESWSQSPVPNAQPSPLDLLKSLGPLLDEILSSEWDPAVESFPTYTGHKPTCDFCGTFIFQSLFQCTGCAQGVPPYLMCPACYVEGRLCCCKHMKPLQRFPFDDLLATRARVASHVPSMVKHNLFER